MSFYDNNAYYESGYLGLDHIKNTKEADCRKFQSRKYLIRDNNIKISNFPNSPQVKVAEYDVDFAVLTQEQGKKIFGTTNVRLAFRTDTEAPKIIGEIHKKYPNNERCLIGIDGEDLPYFYFNTQKFYYGIKVNSIREGMPANKVKIQPDDILYMIDDQPIKDMSFLIEHINNRPCSTHKINFLRNEIVYEATVTPILSRP